MMSPRQRQILLELADTILKIEKSPEAAASGALLRPDNRGSLRRRGGNLLR